MQLLIPLSLKQIKLPNHSLGVKNDSILVWKYQWDILYCIVLSFNTQSFTICKQFKQTFKQNSNNIFNVFNYPFHNDDSSITMGHNNYRLSYSLWYEVVPYIGKVLLWGFTALNRKKMEYILNSVKVNSR